MNKTGLGESFPQVGSLRWQIWHNLTPANLAPYDHYTFPRLQKYWQSHPLRGSLGAISVSIGQTVIALVVVEQINPQQGQILSLWVDPSYRHRGIGTALLQRLQGIISPQLGLTLHYKVSPVTTIALEPILTKLGWQAPEQTFLLVKSDTLHVARIPWLGKYPLAPDYTVFPWQNLNERDYETLARLDYPEVLSPLADGARQEPLNSLGLRYQGQLVGWIVTHRVDAQTIRYSTLFVAPQFRAKAQGLALLSQAIQRQVASPVNYYTFAVAQENKVMLRLFKRYLQAHATWLSESRRAVLLPRQSE